MTPGDVAAFLVKIGLPQYSETFIDEEISGDVLLELDDLSELGVKSPLHQMKIMQLFSRKLQGIEAKYSHEHLCQFLYQQEKLCKYIAILKEHGIDGDMILHVEKNLMKSVLEEIGVTVLDRSKICTKYKTFVSKQL